MVASAEGEAGSPVVQAQLPLPLADRWVPPRVPIDPALLPPGADTQLGQVVLGDVGGGLLVRSRTPGDRLRTEAGTRKLQDLLVDAGVPRAVRDLVPVVAIGDRILWVPGIAVDAEAARAGREDPDLHLAVLTDANLGD
ncbi:MAG: tRNA lysidine(34) synthetase TilS [Actinobacteria bacterium]|nr:tRNA lysidine(34) synthetase TilS [Actinomycetota bacterium]